MGSPLPTSPKVSWPLSAEVGAETGPPSIQALLGRTETAQRHFATKVMPGSSFCPSARNPHSIKHTGSLRTERAVEEGAPQAQPPNYKVTCEGKIQACFPEGTTHHLLQAVGSGAVLGISETKLQVPETTCTSNKDTRIDGSRLRKLLSRHILHVSRGLTASLYTYFN